MACEVCSLPLEVKDSFKAMYLKNKYPSFFCSMECYLKPTYCLSTEKEKLSLYRNYVALNIKLGNTLYDDTFEKFNTRLNRISVSYVNSCHKVCTEMWKQGRGTVVEEKK